MEKEFYFEDDNGEKYYCTQKQWEYWNRKAIAEEKKKFKKWCDEMFKGSNNK